MSRISLSLHGLIVADAFMLVCAGLAPVQATPQFTTLHSFATPAGTSPYTNADGSNPGAALVQGPDGSFYGSTEICGPSGNGTVFSITESGTLATTYSFPITSTSMPNAFIHTDAQLVLGSDGNFYGTTENGGTTGYGTVFQLTPSGTLTTLIDFSSATGVGYPVGTLIEDGNGTFYGVTAEGGPSGNGTVYEVTTDGTASGTTLTTLHSFSTKDSHGDNGDGADPIGLVLGSGGDFYGTTYGGGTNGTGVVFKITPTGTFTTLHSFSALASGDNGDGAYPYAPLAVDSAGNLYGTAYEGGTSGVGTVFKVTSTGTFTTLVDFTSANGANPESGLIQGFDGNFYGTTYAGGAAGEGAVFKVTPTGVVTTLHGFSALSTTAPYGNADGANPITALVLGGDGNLYGTNRNGGASGGGAVFEIEVESQALASMNSGNSPAATLTLGNDGDFFGTTNFGGNGKSNQFGSVFESTLLGVQTPRASFGNANYKSDGGEPTGALAVDPDGNFYGENREGGSSANGTSNGDGTIYKMTPSGTVTPLFDFTSAFGGAPIGGLIRASNGVFYGTTTTTIFKMTTDGTSGGTTFTNLADFPFSVPEPSGVIQGGDGNLYGTTSQGGTTGTYGDGTVFQMTPAGTFTMLYSFSGTPDGANPAAGLVEGSDSSFYGTTYDGGAFGAGELFLISPPVPPATAWTLTDFFDFPAVGGNGDNANGANPEDVLVQGSDGAFYGTTRYGGAFGGGTAFKASRFLKFVGSPPRLVYVTDLTTLVNFVLVPTTPSPNGANGSSPIAGLALGSDGDFYGTTSAGGLDNDGAIYRVNGPPQCEPQIQFTNENTPLTVPIGFIDPSGIGIDTMAFPGSPSHGTVQFVPGSFSETGTLGTGMVTYTPSAGFFGTDSFTCTVTGATGTSGVVTETVQVSQTPATVTVAPNPASVQESATQTFTATVKDAGGATFTPSSLTWSVSGGGAINAATGVFTAGSMPGTFTATATAMSAGVTQTGTASVTVVAGTPSVSASVSPSTLPVIGGTITISATANGGSSALTYYPIVEVYKNGADTGQSFYLSTGNYSTGGSFSGTFTFGTNYDTSPATYTFMVSATNGNGTTTVTARGSTVQSNDTTPPVITATSVSPSTLPVIGGMVTVSATVTDSGSNSTGLSYYPIVEIFKDGTDTGQSFYLSTTGNYTTGGAFTGTFTIPENYDTTSHTYTFKITATDRVSPTPNSTTVTATGSTVQSNDTTAPVITETGISPSTLPVIGGMVTVSATVTDSGNNNTGLSYFPIVDIIKDGTDTGQQFYLSTTGDYTTGGAFTGTCAILENYDTTAHTYTFKITATDRVSPTPNSTTVTATGSTVQANDTTAPVITATGVSPSTLPAGGGTITVSATVTDSGNSNTGLSYFPIVEVYKNGTDTGQQFYLSTTGNYTTGGVFTGTFTAPANSDADYDEYTFVITATDKVTPTPNTTSITASGSCLVASSQQQPAPTLTSISPASGPVNTSVTLTLAGTNFGYRSTVMFGSLAINPSSVSATQLTATVPASALSTAGTVHVTVVNGGPGGGTSGAKTFTITTLPTVTSFTPTSGPVGTVVTVTGTNLNGVTAVRFHNANASVFSANAQGTQLTVTVPAGAGTGTFTITTPGGSVKTTGTFTVIPAPTVTSFTPTSGPAGTVVTVTGTNLNGVTTVRFHNANATVFSVNAAGTTLTVTVPSGAGTGTFTITTLGGSVKTTGTFTVIAPPTVTSFMPTSGPVGTVVMVTGTNLNGVTAVRFHNATAVTFSANAQGTLLTVTVPAGAGTGTFTITTPGGSIKTTGTFTVN